MPLTTILRETVAKNRPAMALALVALLGGGTALGYVYWNTTTVMEQSRLHVYSQSSIPFTIRRLEPPSSPSANTYPETAPAATPFEWISSPALFTDALVLGDKLYLAGPSGITVHDSAGEPLQRFFVGAGLPTAEPLRLAAGLARGTAGKRLYAATAGEGLLIRDISPEGASFQHMRPDQAPYRDLTALLPLTTGRVLLGTKTKGLLVFDGESLSPLHPSLADLHVTALAGDPSSLWIGTLSQGLLHWHAGELDRFSEDQGLPDRQVLSLATSGSTLYAGTPLGVAEFVDGRFERTIAEGFFATALLVEDGRLLVGTHDEGIAEIPLDRSPGRGPRPRGIMPAGPDHAPIRRLLTIGGETFALARDGLYPLAGSSLAGTAAGRKLPAGSAAQLTARNISALEFDSAGNLWVGYFDRGLDILAPSGERIRHIEDQHIFCVNRIVHNAERRATAVATANGLVLFDHAGRRTQLLRRENGLIANHVTDIVVEAESMTVATPAGLTFLDAQGARSLYAFQGLVNNHVYALGSSGDRILAGTLGGLSVLDRQVIRAGYTTANSDLKHNWITAVAPSGRDWFVGTYGAGVARFDEAGNWHAYDGPGGGFEVNPNAMLAAGDRIYAGGLERGLYIYEISADRWTIITTGLPSANVTALARRDGQIYVGTGNGLVRIHEDRLLSR